MTLGVNASKLEIDNLGTSNKIFPIDPKDGKFELPPLGYDFNALEPHIDAQTMEIHYTKHHQAYINKLNDAISKEPGLKGRSLEDLLTNNSSLPESVRSAVRNHGGGHWNHSFFWKSMKTGTSMGKDFEKAVLGSFESVAAFKASFEKLATGVFGSGWAWVIMQNGLLKIVTTPNQDNPILDAGKNAPKVLLGIDVWEHAYYLKHKNKRGDYVSSFWNVVNWDEIEGLLK
ncbi:MAG: superoxide dismutase [Bacteroidia bacterium]|nr:superoxide dismutase [Bacteroidia bacterium]MCF8425529.1 superoxide dismutase [Bacteroidia bacterium]MCF8445842.1 superoxide dismutase [Bacteroidia bacterium]